MRLTNGNTVVLHAVPQQSVDNANNPFARYSARQIAPSCLAVSLRSKRFGVFAPTASRERASNGVACACCMGLSA